MHLLTPFKSRKSNESCEQRQFSNAVAYTMAPKPEKFLHKCGWWLMKVLSVLAAIGTVIFHTWDYWLWQGQSVSVQKSTSDHSNTDLALEITSSEIIFAIGDGSFITVTPRKPLKEPAVVQIQFDDPDIVETMATFMISKDSTKSVFIPLHSRRVAGHCTVTFKSNSPELKNLFKQQVHIKVVHNVFLGYVSVLLGWGYFFAWSAVYYPQLYKNWKRKSVVGLSFDFLSLSVTGHLCYLVFNVAMYYNSTIQHDYTKLHPKGLLPVKLNDVLFSVHAVTLNLLLVTQCIFYERGEQRISPTMSIFVGGLWTTMAGGLFLAISERISWLSYVYYLSYIKVGTTPIKYTPQVYLHFIKKSTEGWSIYSVFLDFSGGVLSFLQMGLDAINNDDFDGTYGNPGKLGLSIIGMLFNGIFMTQHFLLYPTNRKSVPVTTEEPDFKKKLEEFRTNIMLPRKLSTIYDL